MPVKFTHLHVHSQDSLLDGLPKIDQLLDRVKELGMDSIALTDHGNMYGAIEFYKKAKELGIKPILGAELYLAFEGMRQERPGIDDAIYHLTVLVKNEEGYRNLVKLLTKAHLEGFYYKPRVDEELLRKHASGLIALSGCLTGRIPRLLLAKKTKEAEERARTYQEIFGPGNFYLELQYHPNIKEQHIVNAGLIELSKALSIPLVATGDSHYLKQEDSQAQDILMLINTGARPDDPERLTLLQDDFSLKSPEEMAEIFKDAPEALANTQTIANACDLALQLGKTKLPTFPLPAGKTADEYVKELCVAGFGRRPELEKYPEAHERLEYELGVIKQTGFASYFLIVQDFVNWAKEHRIVVGPGRGSVGGSLVAYLLNITNINPLKYNLLFERFLNPERISMPDIDLDFADYRRDEVITYVGEKYGHDRVAQIITFGTMAARAAIRDVGRALAYEYSYCDKVAKMIPFGLTLGDALRDVIEFKELYDTDEKAKKLIDLAKKLEGVARHASTHACGVVISSEPLENIVAVQHPTQNDTNIVTQYEMHSIEDLGLLKMDFLGLKNLSIIEETLKRIYAIYGKNIDMDNLLLDDEKVYKLFQDANTVGIFQVESEGMRRYLKELKPTEFEDIIAMIALYRPGPMELIPDFINRKHGRKRITYLHPKLQPILKNTYGIAVYQEQVLQVARDLAGFTYGEADVLRKAIGKKIKELLQEQREKFIKKTVENGIDKKIAEAVFHFIEPFARYGFNKCVTGDTKIVDALTGQRISIEDLYKKQEILSATLSLSQSHKIKEGRVVDIFLNGERPVFKIRTRSGRRLQATGNHPFLTATGWQNLQELRVGVRVAVPRTIPSPEQLVAIERHRIKLLGYLLAEGNFCHPHGFYFYSTSKDEVQDYLGALESFKNTVGTISTSKRATAVYAKRKDKHLLSGAVEWIRSLGLHYKKATQKFFPRFVFSLSNADLAVLIAKMFQGDGCINLKQNYPQIFYATSSLELADGLQHLLLRFGILSTIHTKHFKYRGTTKVGYTVNINRYDNIQKFTQNFAPYLLNDKRQVLEEIITTHPILNGSIKTWPARGSKDIIPWELVRQPLREAILTHGGTLKAVAKEYGFSERLLWADPRKIGYLRETVDMISGILKLPELQQYAHSDIFWDEIVAIEPKGTEKTYDLTIEGTHNFIANDIFVHNSHSAAYALIAYQTAWLKVYYPVEFMSALLTAEKNDIERIAFLIEETRKMGIEVLPPELNESFSNFSVVPAKNQIRFGLLAIKNVGEGIVDAVIKERKAQGPYLSIQDFINRVHTKDLNKKSMESLIKAGVFDQFGERNQLLSNMDRLLEVARENLKIQNVSQKSLFGTASPSRSLSLDASEPATPHERLVWEKELLGLYVSSHPLAGVKNILAKRAFSIAHIKKEAETPFFVKERRIKIGGIISSLKKIITKVGKPMLFIGVEDMTDKIEVVVFPSVLEKNPAAFQENKVVFITGRLDSRNGDQKLIAEEVEELVER